MSSIFHGASPFTKPPPEIRVAEKKLQEEQIARQRAAAYHQQQQQAAAEEAARRQQEEKQQQLLAAQATAEEAARRQQEALLNEQEQALEEAARRREEEHLKQQQEAMEEAMRQQQVTKSAALELDPDEDPIAVSSAAHQEGQKAKEATRVTFAAENTTSKTLSQIHIPNDDGEFSTVTFEEMIELASSDGTVSGDRKRSFVDVSETPKAGEDFGGEPQPVKEKVSSPGSAKRTFEMHRRSNRKPWKFSQEEIAAQNQGADEDRLSMLAQTASGDRLSMLLYADNQIWNGDAIPNSSIGEDEATQSSKSTRPSQGPSKRINQEPLPSAFGNDDSEADNDMQNE